MLLLLIVGASYRQTIKAYPQGGGSYIVARDNPGETPALVAGGALLLDYILTDAVSVSSVVGALVSAFPSVHNHLVLWASFFIAVIALLNLRGVRESGGILAIPTYLFLAAVAALLVIGIARNAADGFATHRRNACRHVVIQITRSVFGGTNAASYSMQFATIAILVLATNTAKSDFPRLAYFMARDQYMPSQFMFRGDRLAYSFGIITPGILSSLSLPASVAKLNDSYLPML